jgi:hypothetical protein
MRCTTKRHPKMGTATERMSHGQGDNGVAAVSLEGFIADDNDGVGPPFGWMDNGDISWSDEGADDQVVSRSNFSEEPGA